MWTLLQDTLATMPTNPTPPVMEARALEMLRRQRLDMAIKQGCGNLINALILDGIMPDQIAANFEHYIIRVASDYLRSTNKLNIQAKAHEIHLRLATLIPTKAID